MKISFYEAQIVAASFFMKKEFAQSHLTYGAEYDSVLKWLIDSGTKTDTEVTHNSSGWGNYWKQKGALDKVVETGSSEEWCANNIYDLAGNVDEWTQEKVGEKYHVIRGGYCKVMGEYFPVKYSRYNYSTSSYNTTGIRVTIYIK